MPVDIPDLTLATTLDGTELFEVSQGGENKKAPHSLVRGSLSIVSTTPRTVARAERWLVVATDSSAIALTLPEAISGEEHTFRRVSGSNSYSLARSGSDVFLRLDGSTPTSITVSDGVPLHFVGVTGVGWVEL